MELKLGLCVFTDAENKGLYKNNNKLTKKYKGIDKRWRNKKMEPERVTAITTTLN